MSAFNGPLNLLTLPITESDDVREHLERRARPWCKGRWLDLAERHSPLSAEGITTVAAPLTLATLVGDVEAVERFSGRAPGALVVVGSAYAGAVTGATRNRKVRGLVYLATLAPDEREAVAEVFYRTEPHPQAPRLWPDALELIYLPDAAFAAAFAQHATTEDPAVLPVVPRPISPACITAAIPRPLWKGRPRWYPLAEQGCMIVEDNQRFMIGRMRAKGRAHVLDHAPMVIAPALVRDVLREAASTIRSDAAH